jgi:DNA-binding IclR family transcriptional regulator
MAAARLQLPAATTERLLNLFNVEEYRVRLPDLTGFALGARFAELVGFAAASHLPTTQEPTWQLRPPAQNPNSARRKEIA